MSDKQSEDALRLVMQNLANSMTYAEPTNVDTNKKLWNEYAKEWKPSAPHIAKMISNLPEGHQVSVLGEEWSDSDSLDAVFRDFFDAQLVSTAICAEIGVGGGRIASRVFPKVQQLSCFDISSEMLKVAEANLKPIVSSLKDSGKLISFTLLQEPALPQALTGTLDFVYAFDVFPHVDLVDLHTVWKYVQEFKRVLKPKGRALIHTANVCAPQGFARFAQQKKYTAGGFYFMSPDIVRQLVAQAGGFTVLKESSIHDQTSMYYQRDYLILVEKN